MPMPDVTFLSCVHENLPATESARHLDIGWVSILSGLKTLLETGLADGRSSRLTPLPTPRLAGALRMLCGSRRWGNGWTNVTCRAGQRCDQPSPVCGSR